MLRPPAPRPSMKVTVEKAAQSDVHITGEWVGTLDGYVNAQIQPQANGYLVRQDYREGSQVQEGQVLVRDRSLAHLKLRLSRHKVNLARHRRNWLSRKLT